MENFALKGGPVPDYPKRLYHCIFSSYNYLFQDFFYLDHQDDYKIVKQIKTKIYDLTFCKTSMLHSFSEFMSADEYFGPVIFPKTENPVKMYLISYLLYDQLYSFYSDKPTLFLASCDLKEQVHPSTEIVSYKEFFRTRFQEGTVQPFKLKIQYFQPHYLKTK